MDEFDAFDEAYPRTPTRTAPPQPLRRRKSLRERIVFTFVNWCVVTPFACTVASIIVADGIRQQFAITAMRISRFPIPGAHLAERVEGVHKIDLAICCAIALYFLTTTIWKQVFIELLGQGAISAKCQNAVIVIYLLAFFAFVFLALDAAVFYAGMQSKLAGGWSDAPPYTAPAATLIYCCATALLGWFHADYKTSSMI